MEITDPLPLFLLVSGLGALTFAVVDRVRVKPYPGLKTAGLTSTSGHLRFRRPTPDDIDQLIALTTQPRSVQANGWDAKRVAERTEMLTSPDQFKHYEKVCLVAELPTREIVGEASLALHEGTTDEFSIAIHVRTDVEGRGYGTELMRAMIQSSSHINRPLWVGTATTNHGMQRIMERLGYTHTGATESFVAPNGETIESFWYRCDQQK